MEHLKNAFDTIAAEYDTQRQYVIPEMDEFYSTAVWAAEFSVPARRQYLMSGQGQVC